MEILTKSLDFMDKNASEHEQVIEKLFNEQRIDDILGEY